MSHRNLLISTALVMVAGVTSGCVGVSRQSAKEATAEPAAQSAAVGPETRRAFFGELHLHTKMSFDAWTLGTRLTPDDAYRFGAGETVMVPAVQVAQQQGRATSDLIPARRAWALDFMAVTDHSEYLGAVAQLDDPNSAFSRTEIGQELANGGRRAFFRAAAAIGRNNPDNPLTPVFRAAAEAADGWNVAMRAANANYRPGRFTTFVAYEWTASPGDGVHMHRNVIFNSDHAPAPFTAVDSNRPEDLWTYLEATRRRGVDALAIPHNSNLSDGRDFDWNTSDGRPIDEAYALARATNEPLVEIAQVKGASETTPQLSPTDEFANFEIMERIYRGESEPKQHGSYVREGYGRGLVIQSGVGANPFKMGVVGGSDIHNGLSASDEGAFGGGFSGIDPKTMSPIGATAAELLSAPAPGEPGQVRPSGQRENIPLQYASAAITGVWAEQNTRESIFAALKRKETFATSGTRVRVRMFGGFDFAPGLIRQADWVKTAYAQGVPMGSDLPAPARGAPSFILEAMKDPAGANLDRIQVVKIWLDGKTYREKVFDVALSDGRTADRRTGRAPAVGNTVDLKTGAYSNSIGAPTLTTVWKDPLFDPKVPAVYYARVLEIPTPRWSTLMALRAGRPLPVGAPATIQERAWSSPIWFTPTTGRRGD